ncbi:MAG TPA: transglutaminaseTgpA domain-containing protein [Gaiellaceae bacterium]|nr:transglutaminaseTgpA domain-containing protein [Gaiellaceae bacterium]
MRRVGRTIAVSVPALLVLAVAWLRLGQPVGSLWRVLALLALALAAALPRRRWSRVVAAVAATVVAARIVVGVDVVPWRLDRPGSVFGLADSFSALETQFGNGFSDFYSSTLPFDPRIHAAMNELVLSALFLFALGLALLVAARKPVAAALLLLAGAGWPATLLGPSRGIAMGGAVLFALLVMLAGLGSRRLPALALPLAAGVVIAAVAVGSATAARHGLVRWQSWNLAHIAGGPTYVGFVWNAQYGGLKWSGRPINVLQVQSDEPPTYLRAAVLDDFSTDTWLVGLPRSADSLEPPAALQRRNQTRETITVNALADTHLVGGSIPIRFVAADGAPLVQSGPGFASLNQNLPHGFRYTVWSHLARPSAAALRRSPPDYPATLTIDGLFDVDVSGGEKMPAFGTPHRNGNVVALVANRPQLSPYLPLVRLAERVAGGARTPYGAVEDLERWFVSSGTFHYSNHPPVSKPALVGFVAKTHAGYCQYFAGAMALMLRYLGIPARVAVGFAGGTYDATQHLWNVSDREAHAWVEVWFKGYGWLPFDPTPPAAGAAPRQAQAGISGAGGGPGGSASSSAGALTPGAQGVSGFERKLIDNNGFGTQRHHGRQHGHGSHGAALSLGSSGGGTDRSRPILLLLAGLAAVAGGIVLTKVGFRMTRSARRDPRGVAAACRQELASFLLDQRIEAPRSATLGELGDILQREFGVDSREFVGAATAARFGPSEGSAAAAVTARRELRALLEIARRSLSWRDRARGLLSLRSLTRPAAGAAP